jgi:hypothetical protein
MNKMLSVFVFCYKLGRAVTAHWDYNRICKRARTKLTTAVLWKGKIVGREFVMKDIVCYVRSAVGSE